MAKKAPAKRKPNELEANRENYSRLAEKLDVARKPAKRKPRPKKPVPADGIEFSEFSPETLKRLQEILDAKQNSPPIVNPTDYGTPVAFPSWLATALKAAALLVLGSLGGWWAAGGIDVSPGPGPTVNDCLTVAHAADRVTQIAVLKDLASQPFDGATDDGRKKAGEWFNAQRFRNRANDFGAYTDAVAEAVAANTEAELAKKLEGK